MDANNLLERQESILRDLAALRVMKKGTVTHQRVAAKPSRGKACSVRGPYPLLTWKEKGRTRSVRLKTGEEVAWAERAIANYRRFVDLCREYESLAERLALRQREEKRDSAEQALKKRRKPPSSSRPK